jgi:hypothetical protein
MASSLKTLRLYTLSTHGYCYPGLAQADALGIGVSLVCYKEGLNIL